MASVRAKVEHPFRLVKRQFGPAEMRIRGLTKNTDHRLTLLALSTPWLLRRRLLALTGEVHA